MIAARKIGLSLLFASLAVSSAALAQPSPSRVLEDQAYQDCLALMRRNPEEGFAQAQTWQATGGGLPAAHCAALSLVEMKHYGDAADRLEKLLPLAEKQAPHLSVALLDQAANAWILADQPQRAVQLLTIALKVVPDTPDLLIDRAMAYATMQDYVSARSDLDRALGIAPMREDAMALRAAARRQTGDLAGAMQDAEAALTIEPRMPEALLERGILRANAGDKRGARADLIQVRMLAPDTAAAVTAGQYIEQLDVRQ